MMATTCGWERVIKAMQELPAAKDPDGDQPGHGGGSQQ